MTNDIFSLNLKRPLSIKKNEFTVVHKKRSNGEYLKEQRTVNAPNNCFLVRVGRGVQMKTQTERKIAKK